MTLRANFTYSSSVIFHKLSNSIWMFLLCEEKCVNVKFAGVDRGIVKQKLYPRSCKAKAVTAVTVSLHSKKSVEICHVTTNRNPKRNAKKQRTLL